MVKKTKKGVIPDAPTIELGGKFWEMRFSHKAMRRFCGLTKCRMSTFDDALDDYANYPKLFWCIIWAQDESVKLEDVNKWMDEEMASMGDVVEIATTILAAAMKRPMPNSDEEEEDEPDEDEENPM
jgi:hypothetical protein